LAFPSAFAGRAVPSAGDRPADHPATTFVCRPRRPSLDRLASLRFSVPRVSAAFSFAFRRRRPARVIRGRSRLRHTFRTPPGRSRGLAEPAFCVGFGNAPGILVIPFAVLISPGRVKCVFRHSTPRAHVPFRAAPSPPRVSSSRAFVQCRTNLMGLCGPRLLGFGPAVEPFRAHSAGPAIAFTHRVGRSGGPSTALGFAVLSRRSVRHACRSIWPSKGFRRRPPDRAGLARRSREVNLSDRYNYPSFTPRIQRKMAGNEVFFGRRKLAPCLIVFAINGLHDCPKRRRLP